MTIADDNVDTELTNRPRRWDVRSIMRFTLVFGIVSSIFDFLTFATLLFVFSAGPELFRTGWFLKSLLTELAIVLVVRTHRPLYHSRPGKWLLVSSLAAMAVTLAIPYLPVARSFGFVPLPPTIIAVLLGITLAYVICSELAKHAFYAHRWSREAAPAV